MAVEGRVCPSNTHPLRAWCPGRPPSTAPVLPPPPPVLPPRERKLVLDQASAADPHASGPISAQPAPPSPPAPHERPLRSTPLLCGILLHQSSSCPAAASMIMMILIMRRPLRALLLLHPPAHRHDQVRKRLSRAACTAKPTEHSAAQTLRAGGPLAPEPPARTVVSRVLSLAHQHRRSISAPPLTDSACRHSADVQVRGARCPSE